MTITEYIRHLEQVWRMDHDGEAVAFAFALSIFIFGLWPIRLPLRMLRRRRQEKRLIKLLRRSRQGY